MYLENVLKVKKTGETCDQLHLSYTRLTSSRSQKENCHSSYPPSSIKPLLSLCIAGKKEQRKYHLYCKKAFPVFSLITYQEINILLFGVFMILGKQKTPGDIPPGVFCFPQGKQKTPSAIHIIL